MVTRLSQPVLYPRAYGLYVTLASLDVLLTWAILALGGSELNKLAAWIFATHGVRGATFFKFGTVVFVLVVCEFLGRHQDGELGRRLARWAVIISCVPVTVALIELSDQQVWESRAAAERAGHPISLKFDPTHP
jgi:hypothetical protein